MSPSLTDYARLALISVLREFAKGDMMLSATKEQASVLMPLNKKRKVLRPSFFYCLVFKSFAGFYAEVNEQNEVHKRNEVKQHPEAGMAAVMETANRY